jgi:hypothetical protein
MESLGGFDFFPLVCNKDGALEDPQQLKALTDHAKAKATDAIFLAHGFRNDENDARGLYREFLENFKTNAGRPEFPGLASRRYVAAGIFWPSKKFAESFDEGAVQATDDTAADKRDVRRRLEGLKADAATAAQKANLDKAIALLDHVEDSAKKQDELVDRVLSLLDKSPADPTEGLQKIRNRDGSELLRLLETPLILPIVPQDRDEGGVLTVDDAVVGGDSGEAQNIVSFFGSIFGRIGQFLNLTTWYLMKDRAGKVGANGAATAVRALRDAAPAVKIHLVGHSLGGRLMAGCAKKLTDTAGFQVESLTLLQAAFSHYGLSSTPENQDGFFRAVIDKKAVKGPLIATYSAQDTVVGKAYAIASRLANDNVRAIGDANDEFGGIGRNGAQHAQHSIVEPLHKAGSAYSFNPGVINNLDGSGGLITEHGDVRNVNVTYAFASVVSRT